MVGAALLHVWSFVHDVARHEHTWITMQASKAAHRRRGDIKFLEHKVLASVPFTAHEDGRPLPQNWNVMPPHVLGRHLLDDLSRGSKGVRTESLRQWQSVHGPLQAGVVAWPVWWPLAKAMVQGAWYGDFTPLFNTR